MKQFSLCLVLAICLIMPGIAGAVATPALPANISTTQWVGHTFMFLALPAERQAAGYGIYNASQATQGFQDDQSMRIPYLANVGKTVTVTDVSPYVANTESYDYVVSMTEVETGNKYIGRTMRGSIEGLALVDDITNARAQFVGKTIYSKSRSLEDLIPAGGSISSTTIPIGAAMTVVDLYTGDETKSPIWLIVSYNGQKEFIRTAYTWTNQMTTLWTSSAPWQAMLYMDDPRVTLGCSDAVWAAIQAGNAQVGMTKDQVQLSWGSPGSIVQSSNGENWIYGDTQVVSFTGDTATSIQSTIASTI